VRTSSCDEDADGDECMCGKRRLTVMSVLNLLTLTNPLSDLGHVTLSNKNARTHLPSYPQRTTLLLRNCHFRALET